MRIQHLGHYFQTAYFVVVGPYCILAKLEASKAEIVPLPQLLVFLRVSVVLGVGRCVNADIFNS